MSHVEPRPSLPTLCDAARRARVKVFRAAASATGQVTLLVGAAIAYFGVRHLTVSSASTAYGNAHRVMSCERAIGLHHEGSVQRFALHHSWIITVADDIYIYGYWPFIIIVLAWLLARHRDDFAVARNALLLSGGVRSVAAMGDAARNDHSGVDGRVGRDQRQPLFHRRHRRRHACRNRPVLDAQAPGEQAGISRGRRPAGCRW